MASALDRTDITPTDDSGSGTDGTIADAAWVDNLCDQIDALFSNGFELGDYLEVAGDSGGVAAFAGDRYSHVLVAAGLNANPLTANHQVCYYGALQANANVDGVNGFVCGFESAIGLAAGSYTVGKMAAFAVGAFGAFGAGAAATRTWNLSCYDQTAGTNNAVIAMWDATFTGNWFIYYTGTSKSQMSGADFIGPSEIYRSIDTSFMRLAGGNAGGGGAHVLLFGATHATNANKGQLIATGGWLMQGNLTFTDATYDIGADGATRPRDYFGSRYVHGGVTAGITASTTQTQGNGALTNMYNEVATCANANDTVTLPAAVAGRRVTIMNNGAQTLQIFPASGDNLGAGVDTATTLTAGSNRSFIAYDATNWEID